MTDEQKNSIRAMRLKGYGYKAIGKALDLNENRVQLYCKSHGLAGSAELIKLNYPIWCQQNNRCVICGIKITQPKTGRRKKFCSGRCRTRYFRENYETEE